MRETPAAVVSEGTDASEERRLNTGDPRPPHDAGRPHAPQNKPPTHYLRGSKDNAQTPEESSNDIYSAKNESERVAISPSGFTPVIGCDGHGHNGNTDNPLNISRYL
ncbi:unnamed protein product [Pleuronectes platessa]|uniref:Uncharacterized protein n=1 Tax=Pleuronectes platessa TaxID=8262 RepID=A0A9N7UHJ6_PLEPL|nr:unnamed protein product [Pleuronectes platessa]